MTDESEYRPRLTALELAHEKLDCDLRKQLRHSEHLDRKAGQTLQASLAFSGVASAAIYYLFREGDPRRFGTLDTPLAYAALLFGFVSLSLSVATIYHTNLEAEMTPSNVREGALYGRKVLLITFVETYPEYIRRNSRRLEFDKLLLSGAQTSLVLAVLFTVAVVVLFVNGQAIHRHGVVTGTAVSGFVGGCLATVAVIALVVRWPTPSHRRTDPKRYHRCQWRTSHEQSGLGRCPDRSGGVPGASTERTRSNPVEPPGFEIAHPRGPRAR